MMSNNAHSSDAVLDPLTETVANLPLLLLVGGLAATLLPIVCAIAVLTLVFGALFGIPEFTLNETTYEGTWLLIRFGPGLLIFGGLAAAIAFGIWTRKKWGRGLVVIFWTSLIAFSSLAAILYPTGGSFWFPVALCCVPMLLASWLYLYRWGRVVRYYQSLLANGENDDPD